MGRHTNIKLKNAEMISVDINFLQKENMNCRSNQLNNVCSVGKLIAGQIQDS